MTDMSDQDVRDTLREHLDGGPISRLYATGEITEHTAPALTERSGDLFYKDQDEEAARLQDVIGYVTAVGTRPAVARWADEPAVEKAGSGDAGTGDC